MTKSRANGKAHCFYLLCAVILLVTSLVKVISSFGHSGVLHWRDGIFGVPNRWLYLGVACIEMAVAIYLLAGRDPRLKAISVLWLGTNFAVYRFAYWWLSIPEPCACLGSSTKWFPGITPHVPMVLIAITALFIIGGLRLLVADQSRR